MSAPPVDRRQSHHRGWRRIGTSLVRELAFRDFDQALHFVERVGTDAEDHLNRPDMCIYDFNRVRLTITNRHHAGVTQAELRLAANVNAIVDEPRLPLPPGAGRGTELRRTASAARPSDAD